MVAGAALALGVSVAPTADASIVERIVAVVGERPILLSELRHRGRPHLYRIAATTQNASQAAAQESEMFRELLNRLIDERLEEVAAEKAHVTVSPEEVDNGIRQVAAQTKLTPAQLVGEAKKQGLSEQDYRDEIRRQVLEGKLIQLRVRGRVRVTDQDARAAYQHYVRDVKEQSPIDLRILVLTVPPGSTPETVKARQVLAEELTKRARGGEDFCQLVTNFSQDPSTSSTCGSRGPIPKGALTPQLQELVGGLKPGGTADPVPFHDQMGNSAILVIQLASQQPTVAPFDQVKDEMMEKAFIDATDRARKAWLGELRRGVYIDVRL